MDYLKKQAFEAHDNFKCSNYMECLALLRELKHTDSSRLLPHCNEELAEFAKSGWTTEKKFQSAISELKTQLNQSPKENARKLAVLTYNEAVLAFHNNRLTLAEKLLRELFSSQLPVSPAFQMQVVLLFADVYLKRFDTKNADSILSTVEAILEKCSNDKENDQTGISDAQKYRLCLARIRCCLLARCIKRYKRETKMMSTLALPQQSWFLPLFKAHQEFLRDNFQKSLRLIVNINEQTSEDRSFSDSGDCQSAILNNAIGCNYVKLKKYHVSLSYFERALDAYSQARRNSAATQDGKRLPIYLRHSDTYWAILHNYSIALLYAGYAERAFNCLCRVVKVYPRNSRIWLRMAECCITARQKNNAAEFNLEGRHYECVRDIIGVGPHRKIVLNPDVSGKNKRCSAEQLATPSLTIEFAYLCLRNALQLLPQLSAEHISGITDPNQLTDKENSTLWTAPPESPFNSKEVYRLRCSILCSMAYVSLCVGDNATALEAANELLTLEHVSPLHRFLAQFYAAEALIAFDRAREAAKHLPPNAVVDLRVTEFPSNNESSLPPADWHPKNAKTATLALLYNAGVVCDLFGKSNEAAEISKLIKAGVQNGGDCPMLAFSQALYQMIQKEQFDHARAVLQRFFSAASTM